MRLTHLTSPHLYLKLFCYFSIIAAAALEGLAAAHPHLDAFYIIDLATITTQYREWQRSFPDIHPYYAVKANSDQRIIAHLAMLGANFDCASPAEIDLVLATGTSPDRILYANPCKRMPDIKYAAQAGVTLTTFDSECELAKLGQVQATTPFEAILRIQASDPNARCQLSNKYGAVKHEWSGLLQAAKRHSINIVGVSFHVGSGSASPEAFTDAIADCYSLISLARSYGFVLTIVDIGGGFVPGQIKKVAAAVQSAAQVGGGIQFIAEPGRFFAQSAATLYTQIYGKKDTHYWISDGIYGSFNCILYDHATPLPNVMDAKNKNNNKNKNSIIFGPTCDGLDVVATCPLPDLAVGDWLEWVEMGAYTTVGASTFNGMPFDKITKFYVM